MCFIEQFVHSIQLIFNTGKDPVQAHTTTMLDKI